MTCPRCGTKMEGGVCPECGFPVTRYRRKSNKGRYFKLINYTADIWLIFN